jgi:hypothetical protein
MLKLMAVYVIKVWNYFFRGTAFMYHLRKSLKKWNLEKQR